MSYTEKLFSIKDKIVVLTGGTGILGQEYTKGLLAAGARVVILDIKDFSDKQMFKEETSQGQLELIEVDITDRPKVDKALGKIEKMWGVPDALINNAAIDFPPSDDFESFENYDLDKFRKILDVNVTGTLICCQVIGGAMAEKGRGSIINISSIYGLISPDQRIYGNFIKPVSYSVSKSAIFNLTRYLATYWGQKGVRVNTLTLGGVFNSQDEKFVQAYCQKVPLGRMAKKDDYVGAVIFLVSDTSAYMTGSNLIIDGGWTAW